MTMNKSFFTVCVLVFIISETLAYNCSKEEHQRCTSLADPLLKDPKLVFPDNMNDIDNVCRTWSSFVDCIRRYIDKCFSKQRREQFNSAVEVPIASVHQLCSVSSYQAEYLKYASCIKATVIELEHCGNQYAGLVNEVSRSDVTKANLCCAHFHFRTCVITETKKRCDSDQIEGTAAKFARQNLDKALSFLQDQCQNYVPTSGKCASLPKSSGGSAAANSISDKPNTISATPTRINHRSSTPDVYAGKAGDVRATIPNTARTTSFKGTGRALVHHSSTVFKGSAASVQSPARVSMDSAIQATESNQVNQVNQVPAEETNEVVVETTAPTNVAGGNAGGDAKSNTNEADSQPEVAVTQRSASYGRGMSWSSDNPETSSEIPAWATSTWLEQDAVTDDTWYPAAGSFGGNNVDEPNQQGLSKNGQTSIYISTLCYALVFAILYVL